MQLEGARDRLGGDPVARTACSAWAIAIVVLAILAFLSPTNHSVYPIFARAGTDWLASADLYRHTDEPYRYSPLVATLFVPLSLLPASIGGVLWRALNAGVFLAALAWSARLLLVNDATPARRGWLFLLCLPLVLGSLHNGQSNVFVLGLMLAAVAAITTGRWNLSAACLAGACLFKVYPIALGLLLVALYPRRLAWRFALALAVGVGLPFVLQEPGYVLDQYRSWLGHLGDNDRGVSDPALRYRDLRLLIWVCGLDLGYHGYQVVQMLAGTGMGWLCIAGSRAGCGERRALTMAFCLASCWMTSFGPAAESSTYALLAPAAAAALLNAWPQQGLARSLCLMAFALLLVPQIANWFPFRRETFFQVMQPLAGVLLTMHFTWSGMHTEREQERSLPLAA